MIWYKIVKPCNVTFLFYGTNVDNINTIVKIFPDLQGVYLVENLIQVNSPAGDIPHDGTNQLWTHAGANWTRKPFSTAWQGEGV